VSATHRFLGNHSLGNAAGCTGESEYTQRQRNAELASAEYTRRIVALLNKMRGEA
jgi:hypothetical protein